MKVAFTVFADASWTGGLNYLRNLFSALAEVPGRPVVPVLFLAPGTPDKAFAPLLPYLATAPVVVPGWTSSRNRRALNAVLRGHDQVSLAAFRAAGIDVVFFNDAWYGHRFPIPTLSWVADFQHCRLPQMFTPFQRWKRSAMYWAFSRGATRVLVSSQDARQDCEQFFPAARGKIDAVPFAVQLGEASPPGDVRAVVAHHGLPEKFVYFPGQLWRHKNHLAALEAVRRLAAAGTDVVVVSSGNLSDGRHPDHPAQVLALAKDDALRERFRFLGLIPYEHIMPLMRASAAVLNPSLFEGWSTTVEEAKAVGVPLLLSDLRVHREQAPENALFFDPGNVDEMAKVLGQAWGEWAAGPRPVQEAAAGLRYEQQRAQFGRRFVDLVQAMRPSHAG